MLQIRLSVGTWVKGSITAVVGSGMTSMSEAWIGCQPRMDVPSNPLPSSNSSSWSSLGGIVKCCQMPSRSRNLRSTASTLLSFENLSTSFGVWVAITRAPPTSSSVLLAPLLDRVAAALTGPDADHVVDRQDEDLAIADAAGLGRLLDRLGQIGRAQ